MDSLTPIETRYNIIDKIGKGAYGEVTKAVDSKTKRTVAMKRVDRHWNAQVKDNNGFPENAIREIKILRMLNHRNIIRLYDVVTDKRSIDVFLVLEYAPYDLVGLMASMPITIDLAKSISKQLALSLYACHSAYVFHLDIKPGNVLIMQDITVKLSDFGLAQIFPPSENGDLGKRDPNGFITLYYRPPEMLLGQRFITSSVDVWSLACTIYEIICKKPLFLPLGDNGRVKQDASKEDELIAIFSTKGIPSDEEWPGWRNIPDGRAAGSKVDTAAVIRDIKPRAESFEIYLRNHLNIFIPEKIRNSKEYSNLSPEELDNMVKSDVDDAVDLLTKMLRFDPLKRITMKDAFIHPFMRSKSKLFESNRPPLIQIKEVHSLEVECARTGIPPNKN